MADGPSNQRDRLIRAALELFGERGEEATSLRTVAARAQMSLGALSHYFPSKASLAEAVHTYVMSRGRDVVEGVEGHPLARRDATYQLFRDDPAIASYLRRQWLGGGPFSKAFYMEEMALDDAERKAMLERDFPRQPEDPEASILLHRLVGLIPLIFAPAIEAVSGIDVMTPDGIRRWHRAEMELLFGPGVGDLDDAPSPASEASSRRRAGPRRPRARG